VNSCRENPKKIKIVKFFKVIRLPNELKDDTSSLTIFEKRALLMSIRKRNTKENQQKENCYIDLDSNIYFIEDKIQNDIQLQFWSITEDMLSEIEESTNGSNVKGNVPNYHLNDTMVITHNKTKNKN
jgi:hypothetical protein